MFIVPVLHRLRRYSPRSNRFPYTTLYRSPGAKQPSAGQSSPLGGTQTQTVPGFGATSQQPGAVMPMPRPGGGDRKSTRLNSSHLVISYAVFFLKKKKHRIKHMTILTGEEH